MPPVSGATLPIETVRLAGACAFLSSLQLEMQATAAIATTPKWERIMAASGSEHSAKSRLIRRTAHGAVNLTRRFTRRRETAASSKRQAGNAGLFLRSFAYLIVRMYFARVFASSSPTVPFGGIGMGPHTPVEPSLIFFTRYASASFRHFYLA